MYDAERGRQMAEIVEELRAMLAEGIVEVAEYANGVPLFRLTPKGHAASAREADLA